MRTLSKPIIMTAAGLTLCAIFTPSNFYGASRSKEDALKIAENYLGKQERKTKIRRDPSITPIEKEGYFYAFDAEDEKGFVIVSGDDRFEEVLGYADSGSFSQALSNPTFEFWLSSITEEMNLFQGTSQKEIGKTRAAVTAIEPLIKTKWGQWSPYNKYCVEDTYRPIIGYEPQPAPTGCVATAMAQVMNYHQWPPEYNNFIYDWDLMADIYTGTESEEAIEQVSRLMKHCGSAVGMKYSPEASSASGYKAASALAHSFGYDRSIKNVSREMYGRERLLSLLHTELSEGRPVIAGGSYPNKNSGHEFILDGCDSDGLFHVNWGWDGYCDGYYRLTSLCPEDYGTGGTREGYSFDLFFVTGIKPDITGDDAYTRGNLIPLGDLYILNHEGEETITEYGRLDFRISTENGRYGGFLNIGPASFSVYSLWFYTRIENLETGEVKYRQYGDVSDLYVGDGISYMKMYVLKSEMQGNGKYKLSPAYTPDRGKTIVDMEFAPGRRSYFLCDFEDDVFTLTVPKVESELIGAFPTELTTIERKDVQTLPLTFYNPAETEYAGEVRCKFMDAEGNVLDQLTDYLYLDILPDETLSEDMRLYNLSSLETGIYTVGLYDFRSRPLCEPKSIELIDTRIPIDEINFPDPRFRELIASFYDTDKDGHMSQEELSEIRTLDLTLNRRWSISDFTGLEHFYNLAALYITGNRAKTLDLSMVPNLNVLSVTDSPITELDLSNHKMLDLLDLTNNSIEQVTLPEEPILQTLLLDDNRFSSLDFASNCKNLKELSARRNCLSHFNAENFPSLTEWNLDNQDLTAKTSSLDLDLHKYGSEGFDFSRTSDWTAKWKENDNLQSAQCEVVGGMVLIPEEAGANLDLSYSYLAHPDTGASAEFTIRLTRDYDFSDVNGIAGADIFRIEGGSIYFNSGSHGEVYTPAGIIVFSGSGSTPVLPQGIYLIKTAAGVTKVTLP